MIVVDTNVLSETLRPRPDQRLLAWLESVDDDIAVTSITVGELLTGARLLPPGRRRSKLMAVIETTLSDFADSILPYDEPAARIYAELQQQRTTTGRPLSVEDGMIAAVCRHRNSPLATRNVRDFDNLGIDVINPWGEDIV